MCQLLIRKLIRESPHIFEFIYKYYPETFAFLILGILEFYTSKVCEMFVYKHTETIDYVKNYPTF